MMLKPEFFEVQGDGARSPKVPKGKYEGESVVVQGVVTKRVTGINKGFFLQDAEGDGDVNTSDGIFCVHR